MSWSRERRRSRRLTHRRSQFQAGLERLVPVPHGDLAHLSRLGHALLRLPLPLEVARDVEGRPGEPHRVFARGSPLRLGFAQYLLRPPHRPRRDAYCRADLGHGADRVLDGHPDVQLPHECPVRPGEVLRADVSGCRNLPEAPRNLHLPARRIQGGGRELGYRPSPGEVLLDRLPVDVGRTLYHLVADGEFRCNGLDFIEGPAHVAVGGLVRLAPPVPDAHPVYGGPRPGGQRIPRRIPARPADDGLEAHVRLSDGGRRTRRNLWVAGLRGRERGPRLLLLLPEDEATIAAD